MPAKSSLQQRASLRNEDESPLAWLARRQGKDGTSLISPIQLAAGEKLRHDFTMAHMMPRVTTNYSGEPGISGQRSAPGSACEQQERTVMAAERVRKALVSVGPELSGILIDVCCHLKGLEQAERKASWPQRSGKVVLNLALTRLARHYRLETEGPASTGRISQWGTEDFRPVQNQDGP